MSSDTDNPYHLAVREGGRRRIFPSHHGDFSNLEELQDILSDATWPEVSTGSVKGEIINVDSEQFYPHAVIFLLGSGQSYEFIKIKDDTYVVKVRKTAKKKDR